MSNAFKQICEFIKSEEFTTAFEQFKASKEPKKEWEIVAFKQHDKIYKLVENWKEANYSYPVFAHSDDYYFGLVYANDPKYGCTIHSVHRLSDGEIFSVGDRTNNGFIRGFKIGVSENGVLDNNQMYVTCVATVGDEFPCAGLSLRFIKKVVAPLFTTLDGVEIHEGDEFWGIRDWKILDGGKADKYDKVFDKAGETFSTREAAQEYIENNKPLLSLNDVKKAVPGGPMMKVDGFLENLTNIVKQKLNP